MEEAMSTLTGVGEFVVLQQTLHIHIGVRSEKGSTGRNLPMTLDECFTMVILEPVE
jgi:hypothetical protein